MWIKESVLDFEMPLWTNYKDVSFLKVHYMHTEYFKMKNMEKHFNS